MSGEKEGGGIAPGAVEPSPPSGVDMAGMALALGGASREDAGAFLKDQRDLIADQRRMLHQQMEEMREESPLKLSHLRLRRFGDYAKMAFEISIGLLMLAIVAALGAMVWDAAHDDGLVIEAFSVPPDLAARGLTGQVVATQMLDNLSTLQAQNNSSRAPGSIANNWGNDLKVEIPETGVSIGELNRYLHQMLGHQTHITGEVVREGTGLTITARAGAEAGKRISGAEADFNDLLQQATEAVYARAQPYRYGVHLLMLGRNAEAISHFTESTRTGSQIERVWAYAGLQNALIGRGLAREALETAQASVALKPDFAWGWSKVAAGHYALGHAQAAYEADQKTLQLLEAGSQSDLRPDAVLRMKAVAAANITDELGDFGGEMQRQLALYPSLASTSAAAEQVRALLQAPGANLSVSGGIVAGFAVTLARAHDLSGARRVLASGPAFAAAIKTIAESRGDVNAQGRADFTVHAFRRGELLIALANDDWQRVLQIAPVLESEAATLASSESGGIYLPTMLWPHVAYAQAKTGDFTAAHAKLDKAPRDCDLCLRTRGRIDAMQKNWGGAEFWFAEAVRQAPSIPFAYADWGRMLLDRGELDGAIAKFTDANRKSPHFADAIEMWGEALLLQKNPELALAKFVEAEKYAPNWGRLHLKWGEALIYAGKKDEARAQFSRASQLDLTPSEKAELARQGSQT